MLPIVSEVKWLRNDRRRFFTVDNEAFTLFEVNKNYQLGVSGKSLPHPEDTQEDEENNLSPIDKLFVKEFNKNDPPKAVALSYLQDSVVALCFNNKITFHRANADPLRVPDDEMKIKKNPICVDWSSIDKHKLLCICDKTNKEFTFSVYDLEKASNLGYDNVPRKVHWPVREKLTTATFFPEDKDLIGLLSKEFIRIVDIRGRERQAAAIVQSNDGKPFSALHIEPHIGYRFLTYRCDNKTADNEVHIYDRRYLKRPVYVHNEYTYNKSKIRKCTWSPHNRFNIYCLTVDSNKIHEFDVSTNAYDYGYIFKESHVSSDDICQAFDRSVNAYPYIHTPLCFPGIHNIRAFEWHPKYDNEIALIVNKPLANNEHIQLFKIDNNSYAVLGSNNECSYVYKQFIAITESVVQQPLQAHKIKFLESKIKKETPKSSVIKEEILPIQYSEGMFYLDNRIIHNVEACKITNCEDCLRGYLNTRVDETERRNAEDKYFSKYWSQISANAIANIESCKKNLHELLTGDDISVVMRQRVEHGYGYGQARDPLGSMITNCQNAIKVESKLATSEVNFLWNWLGKMNQLNNKFNLQSTYGHYYVGIDVLIDKLQSVSSQYDENCDWGCSRVFTNDIRQQMLQMCLWPEFGDAESMKKICDKIIQEKNIDAFIRAIFLSLAACQGSLAKEYVKKLKDALTPKNSKNIIKSNNKNPNFLPLLHETIDVVEKFNGANLGKEVYEALCSKMEEVPVLLAIIKFLARRLNYALIMGEIVYIADLKIEDRVMFALINMDDKLLQQSFNYLLQQMKLYEPLKAFIFVGLYDCKATHNIILKYYENTNDCQTTSILYLIGHCFDNVAVLRNPSNIGLKMNKLAQKIAESQLKEAYKRGLNCFFDYLEILCSWNMYNERTFLYNQLFNKNIQKGKITRSQAVIACTYCGKAAYYCSSEKIKNHKSRGREILDNFPNRSRISTCANCRKPLPKCIICRHHYGSIIDSIALFGENGSSIDHSFVFCIHCHHGGHLHHLKDWFKDYQICPATGCECKCTIRDGSLIDQYVLEKLSKVDDRKIIKQNLKYLRQSR